MERWTVIDEEDLQTLIKRKEEFMRENMKPLVDLVRRTDLRSGTYEHIAEILVDNADAFRDALIPFDSGIRAK